MTPADEVGGDGLMETERDGGAGVSRGEKGERGGGRRSAVMKRRDR